MRYSVTMMKTFSTVVEVEAESLDEAKAEAYQQEPGDSIVGFEWEPDGESEAIAVYQDGQQVWSAFTKGEE